MMKAIVCWASLFENVLHHEVIEVDSKDWKKAVFGSKLITNQYEAEWVAGMSEDLEEAKQEFLSADVLFSVLWMEKQCNSK